MKARDEADYPGACVYPQFKKEAHVSEKPKFYVGQKGVKTRDGRDVEIVLVDARGIYSIRGYIGEDTHLSGWLADGKHTQSLNFRDLILPKRKIEQTVWLNIYATTKSCWDDEGIARAAAGPEALIIAHPVTFTVEVDG